MVALCGNQAMEQLINELRELVLPGRHRPWVTVSGMKRSAQQHFEMVDALDGRDLDRLTSTIRTHIMQWRAETD